MENIGIHYNEINFNYNYYQGEFNWFNKWLES